MLIHVLKGMCSPLMGASAQPSLLAADAAAIWQAAVEAVRPEPLIRQALADPALGLAEEVVRARRILVLGGGKAGSAMSRAVEQTLAAQLDKLEGVVNVPAEAVIPLQKI